MLVPKLLRLLVYQIVLNFVKTKSLHGSSEDNSCSFPDLSYRVRKDCGSSGCCIPLSYCKELCELLGSIAVNITIRHLLHDSFCGFLNGEPLACCPNARNIPSQPVCSLRKQPPKTRIQKLCGVQSGGFISSRITSGFSPPPGDFPWMVALKYLQAGRKTSRFGCGGTLISDQWVLTAGHCIDIIIDGLPVDLVEVRLGDTNFKTNFDCMDELEGDCQDDMSCVEDEKCAPQHQSFKPVLQIKHPGFNSKPILSYDLALIKLNEAVVFNDFVIPVCLPSGEAEDVERKLSMVSGWGNTIDVRFGGEKKFSDTLQALQVNILEQEECQSIWENLLDGIMLQSEHLCARADGSGQVCIGDSGGALVSHVEGDWVLDGIVSFGIGTCTNSNVYSKLTGAKVDWIQRTIA